MDHDHDATERRLRLLEFQTDLNADPTSETNLARRHENNFHAAQEIMGLLGGLLDEADRGLSHLEEDDALLGSALFRGCQEFADAVGHLAGQLEEQQHQDAEVLPAERQALAEACLQDFNDSLRLEQEQQQESRGTTAEQHSEGREDAVSVLTREDFTVALGAAAELLRDVESALRAIEKDEADDIADAALGVAHLFLLSCRQLHAQVTPRQLADHLSAAEEQQQHGGDYSRTMRLRESPNIEILEDDEDNGNEKENANTESKRKSAPSASQSSSSPRSKLPQPERMRCLWPPVGPAVGKALHWSQKELEKKHWLLTAALGITLWPVAVATALVGTPAVLADHCLQQVYQHFQNGPLLTAAEVAAAQLYQTSRLMLLTGRAVAKPTARVAKRQLQRHGPAVQDWAVNKLTHPLETAQETAHGLLWCTEQVVGVVQQQIQQWQQQQSDPVLSSEGQPRVQQMQ